MQIHFSLLLFPPTVFPRQLSSVSLALLRLTRISVQLHPPPPPSIVASSHRRRNRDRISPHKCEPYKGFGWIFSFSFFSPSSSDRSFIGKGERSRHPVCAQHNASLPLLFIRIKWAITKNPEVCVVSPSFAFPLSLFSGNKKRVKDSVSLLPVSQKAPSRLLLEGVCASPSAAGGRGLLAFPQGEGDPAPSPSSRSSLSTAPSQKQTKHFLPPLKKIKSKTQTPNKNRKRHRSARRGGRVLQTATRAGASSSRAWLSPQ